MRIPSNMHTNSVFYPGLVSTADMDLLKADKDFWSLAQGLWVASTGQLQVGYVESELLLPGSATYAPRLKGFGMVNCSGAPQVSAYYAVVKGRRLFELREQHIDSLQLTSTSALVARSVKPNYIVSKFIKNYKPVMAFDEQSVVKKIDAAITKGVEDVLYRDHYRRRIAVSAQDERGIMENFNYDMARDLLSLYSGDIKDRGLISQETRSKLDSILFDMRKLDAVCDESESKVREAFSKNKWLVGLYAHGVMVGEISGSDLLKLYDNMQSNVSPRVLYKTPTMYRSLRDIPESIRPSLMAGLSMFNMTRKGMWAKSADTNFSSADPDNLIGYGDDYSLEAGWISWHRAGRVQWLITDKD